MLDSSHSVAMFEELDKGALIYYRDRALTHKKTKFRVLTGFTEYFTVEPLISIGSSPLTREIISLDPENSPLLQQKYDQFSGASFEELIDYIRTRIFRIKTSDRLMDAFIFEWTLRHTPDDFTLTTDNRYLPIIPLDDFIRSGVGVCRHSALTAAYFIDRLIQDGRLPSGSIRYVRDTIKWGGHAWVLFFPDESEDIWHIDPHLSVVVNCRTDAASLYPFYGQEAIDRQLNRFAKGVP